MKKALQVAMFSLFTVIGFNAQANEHHHETMSEVQPQVISATGVVKGIDLESKKITIHHDPIAASEQPVSARATQNGRSLQGDIGS